MKASRIPILASMAPNYVRVGMNDDASAGVANWSAGGATREFILLGHDTKIRQEGDLTRVRFYVVTVPDTSMYITVWRYNGSTYDRVGISEDIVSQLSDASYCTVTFTSKITDVQEGDTCIHGFKEEW